MKINRKERVLMIEALENSIEADENMLKDELDADQEGEIRVTIEEKRELMLRLGEPIGYFTTESEEEE